MSAALPETEAFKALVGRLRDSPEGVMAVEARNLLVAAIVVSGSGPRGDAVRGMTLDEFEAADQVDGLYVKDHKTGAKGPVRLPLTGTMYQCVE